MTSDEIQNERREDYKLLGRFIGLAELAEMGIIHRDKLYERMIELINEYRQRYGFCPHGKRLDDRLGCAQCDETVGEVRQSV